MAQHTHMDLPLQQRPTPLLTEHLYSVPQLHHKRSDLESSWKASYRTVPKLTWSMLLNTEQMHRVPESSSVAGRIRIPNTSTVPHTLKRNEHFCQASPVFEPTEEATSRPPHLTAVHNASFLPHAD